MRISDWSSYVCSSDLKDGAAVAGGEAKSSLRKSGLERLAAVRRLPCRQAVRSDGAGIDSGALGLGALLRRPVGSRRTEERRVGKVWVSPCRYRWSQYP